MNKELIAGACLAVVLAIGGIFAFIPGGDNSGGAKSGSESRSDSPASSETTPATAPSAATSPSFGTSGSPPAPGAVVFPTPSLPAGSEDAEAMMAINQIIFEITRDANRPADKRMSPEEINALIQSRIKELREGR